MAGSWPIREHVRLPSVDSSPLTDQPLWQSLSFAGYSSSNPIPDGAPWLIAARTGDDPFPELPRFARLRGHLGDPAFAECPAADRIFAVEDVVEVHEDKREFTYPQEDYGRWLTYSDPLGRFRLAYPPDWDMAKSSDDLITLHSEQWPDSPVTMRVIEGAFDPTAVPGDVEVQTWDDQFRQRPPEALVTSDVPALWGDVRFCAGDLTDGCVEVIFSHAGNDYVLRHDYPTGFAAREDTLWTFQHIADAFWIEGRATITPTPTANTTLGDGPFWTREQAEELALSMIPFGPWSVTDAVLTSEAEAVRLNLRDTRRDDPDDMWHSYPEGVWIIELTGNFDGRDTVYYTYLDAETGQHVCTAEKGTRQGAGSLPTGTPTPPPG